MTERNRATNKFLSGLEIDTKKAVLESQGYGKDDIERALLEVEYFSKDDAKAVRMYVTPLIAAVREHGESVEALRSLIPVINEVANKVRMEDATLTKAEKARIEKVCKELITAIGLKLTIVTRIGRKMKSVVPAGKKAITAARENAAGAMSESGSLMFGALGRILAPKAAAPDTGKAIADQRATTLQTILRRRQEDMGTKVSGGSRSPWSDDDEDDDDDFMRMMMGQKPKKKSKKKSKKTDEDDEPVVKRPRRVPVPEPEPDTTPRRVGARTTSESTSTTSEVIDAPALKSLLTTNKSMLVELRKIEKYLKTADRRAQSASEAAGEQEGVLRSSDGKTTQGPTPAKKVEGGGLLSSLFSMLGEGGGGLLGLLKGMVMPALTALGTGAAVIGAAFAGWKIGEWIDKMTGASNLVQKAAEFFANKMGLGGYGDAERAKVDSDKRTLTHARETSGNPNMTLEQAKQFEKDNIARMQAQRAAGQTPTPRPVQPAAPTKAPTPAPAPAKAPNASLATLAGHPMGQSTSGAPTAVGTPPSVSPSPVRTPAPATKVESTGPAKVSGIDPKNLHMSEDGIARLKKLEGAATTAYWDVNGYAIGYGQHTWKGKPVVKGQKVSKQELDEEMRRQLPGYEDTVRKALKVPVTQGEFDSMVSVAWNTGSGAYLAKIRNQRALTQADFNASAKERGKEGFNAQLLTRRAAEFQQASMTVAPNTNRTLPNGAPPARNGAPVVIAPQTVMASNQAAPPSYVPVPITTENPDATARGIRSMNVL